MEFHVLGPGYLTVLCENEEQAETVKQTMETMLDSLALNHSVGTRLPPTIVRASEFTSDEPQWKVSVRFALGEKGKVRPSLRNHMEEQLAERIPGSVHCNKIT